jgi:hypothetical protein
MDWILALLLDVPDSCFLPHFLLRSGSDLFLISSQPRRRWQQLQRGLTSNHFSQPRRWWQQLQRGPWADGQIIFSQPQHLVSALCQQDSAHASSSFPTMVRKKKVLTDASCAAAPKEEQAFCGDSTTRRCHLRWWLLFSPLSAAPAVAVQAVRAVAAVAVEVNSISSSDSSDSSSSKRWWH